MPRSVELIFCGLVFWIYCEKGAPHHLKQVEVAFKRHRKGLYDIETGECYPNTENTLDPEERAKAQEIIRRYRQKLLKDWHTLQAGQGINNLKLTEKDFYRGNGK